MYKKRPVFKKLNLVLVAIITVIAVCPVLNGCSFFDLLFNKTLEEITFSEKTVNLTVGESFDLSTIVKSSSRTYTFTSADPSVALVMGKKVTGRAEGTTYITAQTGSGLASDELSVVVSAREKDEIKISAQGEITQTTNAMSTVVFTPTQTGKVKGSKVKWYVNNVYIATREAGATFSFVPTGVGMYIIKASVDVSGSEFFDTGIVRVFLPISASVALNGEPEQTEPFTPIEFTASIDEGVEPVEVYYEWFVNDVCVSSGADKQTYTLSPKPGKFRVKLKVNGGVHYDSEIRFIGSVTPDAPTVEFNNVFPHFYIHYDTGGLNAKIKIKSPTGEITEYSQNDTRYSSKFSNGRFDAGSYVKACPDGFTRGTYEFSVASLGDGDVLTESEYSQVYAFTQLPGSVKQYLEEKILDGDLYIINETEYAAVAEYYIFFRNKTVPSPKVTFSCYVAFELSGSASDLWNSVFQTVSTSGSYYETSVSMNNRVITTSFRVSTVNDPSRQVNGTRASQLHAILPHINYDPQQNRPSNYVFPIDRREREVSVTYSDELYLAAARGSKPVPTAGSKAQIIYEKAREVLSQICTDSMTDVQKAHAIYDWVMWKVTYDTPATKIADNGESLASYYLEGVFGDGSTAMGGVVYKPYAVCDGISKAYALMCNIEGIPCVRVTGVAGSSLSDAGGHAWNKVFINGGWYMVDCTWGDTQTEFRISGLNGTYELGMHEYLFLTGEQASYNHFEPHVQDNGESIVYAPVTSEERFNIYDEMVYMGTPIDCGISNGENKIERMGEIARAFAQSYSKMTSLNVPGCGATSITWQGIDVQVDGGLSSQEKSLVRSTVETAIKSVHRSASVNVSILDNIVIILIKT